MSSLSLEPLVARFPDFRVAVVIGEGLTIPVRRSPVLSAEIAEIETRCRTRWAGTDLSAIPGVAVWRGAYRAFGIKKTSYRSSVERLIKRVLAGEALPEVNALVDLYNAVSVEHGLCLGCDDGEKIVGDLAFRYSRPDDTFLDMSAGEGEDPNDPPKDGEVVYADASHVLCRRWNWRQDARTLVTAATRRVVLTAQSNGYGAVEAAAATLVDGIAREFGGACRVVVAEATRPVAKF
jgi:DNA/RNA-binding domain of Phe-tRNA-synthetase-like protein